MAPYDNLWQLMAIFDIFDIYYLILKIRGAACISDAVFYIAVSSLATRDNGSYLHPLEIRTALKVDFFCF